MAKLPDQFYEEEKEDSDDDSGHVGVGTWIGAVVFFISLIMLVALVAVFLMKKF